MKTRLQTQSQRRPEPELCWRRHAQGGRQSVPSSTSRGQSRSPSEELTSGADDPQRGDQQGVRPPDPRTPGTLVPRTPGTLVSRTPGTLDPWYPGPPETMKLINSSYFLLTETQQVRYVARQLAS
ncbi:hypothetical protein EYF80_063100 [Liparis tanakae]|uniref:Uncharacterized protein n=1 Tax=Liparis tanakae TaxID=230148 RepID=A0A4Z2EEP3_9TELE|nr:hypothetical protein EYF80_063100 [Liparis tanakae]